VIALLTLALMVTEAAVIGRATAAHGADAGDVGTATAISTTAVERLLLKSSALSVEKISAS
jgi:hypothetical protein